VILLKHILVATDFGEPSDAALAYGRQLARAFNARLTVFHAAENLASRGYGSEGFVFIEPDSQSQVEAAALERVRSLISDEDRHELGAEAVVVTAISPAAAIADYAQREQVDLIIVGTHGRRGVAHLMMGSVAERVVRTAPCPVLTVRHPEHEFVLPDALVALRVA
jgi:nucleotide-binding universal stress UspA family protein